MSRLICIGSPLFATQVSQTLIQLIVRYHVVLCTKASVTGTAILIIPTVYILVVYRLFKGAAPLHMKCTFSGVVSRIANISAIYFVESYCDGIWIRLLPLSYLTGTLCLYIPKPNA